MEHDKAGLQVLAALKQVSPDTEAVIMTGYGSTETAVEALRLGAFDYLTKPCKLADIEALLLRIQEKRKLKNKTAALETRVQAAEGPGGLDRQQPGDGPGAAARRSARPDRRPRADHRRDRHRQGHGRPGAVHQEQAGRHAVRAGELRAPCPARWSRVSYSGTRRGLAQLWQGNAAEAEQTLSLFDPDAMTEVDLLRWGAARIVNLQWSMGDSEGAREVLALLRDRVTRPGGRLFVDGLAAITAVSESRLDEAVHLCERVLADPAASPHAVERAVIGGTFALSLMGRFDRVAEVAVRGHQVEAVEAHVEGLLRHLRAFGEIWGLVLAGDFDTAEQRSADIVRISSPGQYLAWGMVNQLASMVEVARGRFPDALMRMEQTVAAMTSESTAAWSFPARLLLAQSYCALGRTEPGAKMVAELRTRFGRHLALFEPQLRLTEAWLYAAQGNVSAAIERALHAGDVAKESGQRAIELCALHDAIRFGDRTALHRVVDIASGAGGQLAPLYRAHAAALADRDAAAVYAAAEQFERIGALLSAADAAAQAAVLFNAAGDRRRTLQAAAAADRLAAACGGVKTPALMLTAQPLPLSNREREIANLVAHGLSNRDIAERLVVSARTVEGHIYRACIKLDVTDREELAAVISKSNNR